MTQTVHRLCQILRVVEKETFYLRAVILRLFPQTGPLAADQLFLSQAWGRFHGSAYRMQTAMASAQQRALEISARYARRVPPRFPVTVRLNVMNP